MDRLLEAKNCIAIEIASLALRLKLEFVDLTTPELIHDKGLLNISSPPIINLVTPKPA